MFDIGDDYVFSKQKTAGKTYRNNFWLVVGRGLLCFYTVQETKVREQKHGHYGVGTG